MNNKLLKDKSNFLEILNKTIAEGYSFLENIDFTSTQPNSLGFLECKLPDAGLGAEKTIQYFSDNYKNLIAASSGSRYWGFVTGGATPAAISGDILASIYDQNTQRITQGGDCSAIIERETIKMLLNLFSLPSSFDGGLVTGATMSNFTCLATARQWCGKNLNIDIAQEGNPQNEIVVLSAEPHSSIIKCLSMLGIGRNSVVKVKKLPGRECMDLVDLKEKLDQLSDKQIILCTSAGTVNTVDFDDFSGISSLRDNYNFWWHIDAAFGGFAALSDDFKNLLQDWDLADSITIDFHKWLNVPYENAAYFIKKNYFQMQLEVFQNSNAAYLGDPYENFSYGNLGPENSRRFRALPIWFTLMAYGRIGYKEIVENSIEVARYFSDYINHHSRLKLLAPLRLNCVCFSLENDKEKTLQLLNELNKGGKVFMTSSIINDKTCIRAAFVNWRTTKEDIDIAIKEIENVLKFI